MDFQSCANHRMDQTLLRELGLSHRGSESSVFDCIRGELESGGVVSGWGLCVKQCECFGEIVVVSCFVAVLGLSV